MSVILTKPVYQLLNEGWHDGGLLGIVDKGYIDYGRGPRHMLEMNFITDQLHAQTGQPLEIRWLCSATLHRKGKLYSLVMALLGTVPDTLNLDSLVGRTCRLSIVNRPGKNGAGVYSNIESIVPPAKISSPLPPPPTQPATPGQNFTLPATK